MQIKLFDSKRLDLPLFFTIEERCNYIRDNFLKKEPYAKYYMINCRGMMKAELENVEYRWLGTKNVNMQYSNAHLENVLSSIGSYIISCEEYSNKPLIKETKVERSTENIIYMKTYPVRVRKKNIIFMINLKEEEHLKENIKVFKKVKRKGYSEEFMYRDSLKRLEICEKTTKRCMYYKSQIAKCNKDIEEIKNKIKEYYFEIKNEKNKGILEMKKNNILSLSRKMYSLKKEIKYLEDAIELEYEDYYSATEFITSSR